MTLGGTSDLVCDSPTTSLRSSSTSGNNGGNGRRPSVEMQWNYSRYFSYDL